ncbi:MAG: nickel pincer cofactor biosynthesis protein LarC [Phycisphaerae bacterium]|nr:nickel pincer cofactor biosynthesis protein LarC [Phycisphaerae bacterium]
MRIAYFDCFSGASGDMILGALLDAGVDLDALRGDLASLGVGGYSLAAERIRKQGFAATQFEVHIEAADKPHRHLKHIREIIEKGRLPDLVRQRAMAIFTKLAEAEAEAHGTSVDKVHFHEVGAIDSIVDIVGACLALDRLGVEEVHCSPIPTGSGTLRCEHGVMPVPAPATARLLRGVPLAACEEMSELTTPTGAVILTTVARSYGPVPAMVIERVGVGAGKREGKTRPNILRVLIGEAVSAGRLDDESDEVLVLEANLDDATGEVVGHVYDLLFAAGALDVYSSPIYMKKNRPATLLTVLAPPPLRETIESILFAETTTFGIRSHLASRHKLARTFETVETGFGPVRIKVGCRQGRVVTASPEFEDCREAAKLASRPLREIMDLAMRIWRSKNGGSEPA